MLKTRRSHDRPMFNMGIPIPRKDSLYIEMGPCFLRDVITHRHRENFWALQDRV